MQGNTPPNLVVSAATFGGLSSHDAKIGPMAFSFIVSKIDLPSHTAHYYTTVTGDQKQSPFRNNTGVVQIENDGCLWLH